MKDSKSGESKKSKGFWGNDKTEHYDNSSNKIGESREANGFWGDEKIEHLDSSRNKIGESKKATGFGGSEKTEHFDNYGNKVGESKKSTTLWGNEKTEHFDNSGNKTGESKEEVGFWGNKRTDHYGNDTTYGETKKKSELSKKYSGSSTASSSSMPSDLHWSMWLAILPAILIYGLFALIYSKVLGEKFSNSKLARILTAPLAVVSNSYIFAYILVSIIWFILLNYNPEWSTTTNIILALVHPLLTGIFVFVVMIFLPIAFVIQLIAGDIGFWEQAPMGLLLVTLSMLPYYIAGIIMMPFQK